MLSQSNSSAQLKIVIFGHSKIHTLLNWPSCCLRGSYADVGLGL